MVEIFLHQVYPTLVSPVRFAFVKEITPLYCIILTSFHSCNLWLFIVEAIDL